MALRLHSLVWNKIMLLITADAAVEKPQVSRDEEAPEQNIGILIPVGMEYDTLIDFIFETWSSLWRRSRRERKRL
ncbi:hypothetical protein PF005_g27825 [Phytophthora fragariae]|uniref:Uncharacterized protein n=2 Tax=Phytophthora fragariae TaxID=53985 RepID=A0A6A3DC49_9STRA|nr:hypothetical protein PF003_g4714 [Phytophthora fragariae]KAE8919142.1 hypothetical protein PF009_g30546 [Phytophthora fragariae]KAE8962430.1 hypothetical protein PF011_g29398 [Phytophthora fragariae]KAE9061233.1 hypothetical protein PF010_g29891 [Phytophthora fragariae]KAE9061977.1 hypothetical protein PF007_g30070 [Phytophthora fragariae]